MYVCNGTGFASNSANGKLKLKRKNKIKMNSISRRTNPSKFTLEEKIADAEGEDIAIEDTKKVASNASSIYYPLPRISVPSFST